MTSCAMVSIIWPLVIDGLVYLLLLLNFGNMFNGKTKIIGNLPDKEIFFCTDASMTGFGATLISGKIFGFGFAAPFS